MSKEKGTLTCQMHLLSCILTLTVTFRVGKHQSSKAQESHSLSGIISQSQQRLHSPLTAHLHSTGSFSKENPLLSLHVLRLSSQCSLILLLHDFYTVEGAELYDPQLITTQHQILPKGFISGTEIPHFPPAHYFIFKQI